MRYGQDDNHLDKDKQCRRISDHRLNFQSCNSVHEHELIESGIFYIGEGAYRQVFAIEHDPGISDIERIVIKDLHADESIQFDNFE